MVLNGAIWMDFICSFQERFRSNKTEKEKRIFFYIGLLPFWIVKGVLISGFGFFVDSWKWFGLSSAFGLDVSWTAAMHKTYWLQLNVQFGCSRAKMKKKSQLIVSVDVHHLIISSPSTPLSFFFHSIQRSKYFIKHKNCVAMSSNAFLLIASEAISM